MAQSFPIGYWSPIPLLAEFNQRFSRFMLMENNTPKCKERIYLEDLVTRYLSLINHDEKFSCAIITSIVDESLGSLPDIPLGQMANAWEMTFEFLLTVIQRPSMKEYQAIRWNSGFFTYQICNSIARAERIFQLIGYRKSANNLMRLKYPIDLDLVRRMSKDSFVAMVECKIIQSIYDDVAQYCLDLKVEDVVAFRKHNVCSRVQAAKQLLIHCLNNHDHYDQLIPFKPYRQTYAAPGGKPIGNRTYGPIQHMPHYVTNNKKYQPPTAAASVHSVPAGQPYRHPPRLSRRELRELNANNIEEVRRAIEIPDDVFESFMTTKREILEGVAMGRVPVNRSSFHLGRPMR